MPDYRAHFDFDLRVGNGGALSGTGFRLDLPPQGARFAAAPPAVEGFGTFPVRAFAEVPA